MAGPGLALARSRPHLIATPSQERVADARPPAYGLWRDPRRVPHDLPPALRAVSEARHGGAVRAPRAAGVLRAACDCGAAAEPGPRARVSLARRPRLLRRKPGAHGRHDPRHLRFVSRPRAAPPGCVGAGLVEALAAHRRGIRQGHRAHADCGRGRRRRGGGSDAVPGRRRAGGVGAGARARNPLVVGRRAGAGGGFARGGGGRGGGIPRGGAPGGGGGAAPPADSLRRALGEVFARPEYAWVPRFSLGDWLHEQALRLLDWIGRQHTAHPAAFKVVLGILIVVLAGLLLHTRSVPRRSPRPTGRTP